jgi:hypothetical protein
MPTRLSDEERKERKAQKNKRYYEKYRERILQYHKEHPHQQTREERRTNFNRRTLDQLIAEVDDTLKPYVKKLKELELYKRLYQSEMDLVATLFLTISETPPSPEERTPPPEETSPPPPREPDPVRDALNAGRTPSKDIRESLGLDM